MLHTHKAKQNTTKIETKHQIKAKNYTALRNKENRNQTSCRQNTTRPDQAVNKVLRYRTPEATSPFSGLYSSSNISCHHNYFVLYTYAIFITFEIKTN